MSLTTSKFKKLDKKPKKIIYQESKLPFARNRIYQRRITFGCPYCTLTQCGRKRHFKTLYLLWCHLFTHHPLERTNNKDLVTKLAKYIISGVLLE